MSDFLEQLRRALQARLETGEDSEDAASADLVCAVPADLVFDDEPIEDLLYHPDTARPSSSNLFDAAQRFLDSMDRCDRAGDVDGLMQAIRQLVLDGVPLSNDGYGKIAPLLPELLARSVHCLWDQDPGDRETLLKRLSELAVKYKDLSLRVATDIWRALLYEAQARGDEAAALWEQQRSLEHDPIPDDGLLVDLLATSSEWFWKNVSRPPLDHRLSPIATLLDRLLATFPEDAAAEAPDERRPQHDAELLTRVEPALGHLAQRLRAADDGGAAHRGFCRWCLAVAVLERTAGASHPLTTYCLNMLVRNLQLNEDHETAIRVGRSLVEIQQRHLHAKHPWLATSLNNLGLSLVHRGEFVEAESVLQRACTMRPEFPNPKYWRARLVQLRGRQGDDQLEMNAWREFLEAAKADSGYRSTSIGRGRMQEGEQRYRQLLYR